MKNFRSLLLADVRASAAGVRLLRLAVHRHLPDLGEVEAHRHRYSQLLLYLTGRGIQEIDGARHAVGPGSLILLPPGVAHAFHRTAPRPPLCLALDFSGGRVATTVTRVTGGEMREIRDALRRLAALAKEGRGSGVRACAGAMGLLGRLLDAARPGAPAGVNEPMAQRVRRLLAEPGGVGLPIRELARRVGRQPDYLNRRVKVETGLTLNQLRAEARLARAQEALARSHSVAEAAVLAGFEDANYFTRWFRQQAGMPPGAWKAGAGKAA